jgi:hypothetical protein
MPRAGAITRSGMKIGHDAAAIETVFVALFLDAFRAKPPRDIILDLDATDDPIHGHQEGRFFHGYYDCYCYLPLYVFCGRHLLAAKLRRSNIDASAGAEEEVARIVRQIRARWPRVRIVLRADAGFAREALMLWCEQNRSGASRTASTSCLAWPATPGLRPASRPPSKRPGPGLRRPVGLRACSGTCSGRPRSRGHAAGG